MKSYKQHLVEMYVNIEDIGEEFTSSEVVHWIREFHGFCTTSGEVSWILSHLENVESRTLTRGQQKELCTGARIAYRKVDI